MQRLNTVHSTGKYCNRGQRASSIAATQVASDIKAAGRYEKGISRSNRISKEVSRPRISATCNTELVTLYSNCDRFHVLIRVLRIVNIFYVLTD
jgi:hypothetical protein